MIFNYFAISMVIFLAFLDSLSLSLSLAHIRWTILSDLYMHTILDI